jgi:hypothetical protein
MRSSVRLRALSKQCFRAKRRRESRRRHRRHSVAQRIRSAGLCSSAGPRLPRRRRRRSVVNRLARVACAPTRLSAYRCISEKVRGVERCAVELSERCDDHVSVHAGADAMPRFSGVDVSFIGKRINATCRRRVATAIAVGMARPGPLGCPPPTLFRHCSGGQSRDLVLANNTSHACVLVRTCHFYARLRWA